jgi:hypothetical protein
MRTYNPYFAAGIAPPYGRGLPSFRRAETGCQRRTLETVSADTYTLTVFVEPYHSVTLSERDVDRLLAKLGQIEKVLGAFPERKDVTDAIARIEAGPGSARGVEFKPGEDGAILRALDELRVERPLGARLVRLRDALLDQVGPSARTYQLELHQADGSVDRSQVFYSYSGGYLVGERLPLLPDGDCWEVEVAKQPTDSEHGKLVCRPCPIEEG